MAKRKLERYRELRDFDATPEPGGEAAGGEADAPRFVVHEHHARRLHWDLRLERDGVLVSWAIPKGIPADPKRNHLAVHVEDHPLDYIDFAGEIPAGSYGAGEVLIWDSGTYETHKFRDDEVMVTFHGERLDGKYVLFRTRGNDWLIHRMDPPEDPGREPMPDPIRPMLAVTGRLPADDAAYGFEIKWDGVRAVLHSDAGHVRAHSRNMLDITSRYPELRELGRTLGSRQVVLDGELVAFDERGRPSFELLQRRMHLASDAAVRRVRAEVPAVYLIFDVLYLDGHSTLALPYGDRRRLLERLELAGPSWQTPAHHEGDAAALLEATREQGLEGVVAKRLDSVYEPGRRSRAWIKVKTRPRQEIVIGGWMPGEAGRSGRIGSLLAGYYDAEGRLRYAGRVGTGFTDATLQQLAALLEPLRRESSPFEGRQPPRGAVFAEPRLVGEVEFAEWTKSRTLRAPSFKGLRDDKDPSAVVLEV